MSALYNEYIIASNNSVNDNKYNSEKMTKSTSYKIKRILMPILKMFLHKSTRSHKKEKEQFVYDNQKNASIESSNDFWASEIDENSANEELESRIFREIEQCQDNAAVYVYENDDFEIQPVQRDQRFVPVHFARTEAGTFFWTMMQKPVDCDLVQPTYCCSEYQQPQIQFGDRWVQA